MCRLKPLYCLFVALLVCHCDILATLVTNQSESIELMALHDENKVSPTNSSAECILKLKPLHYEINLEPRIEVEQATANSTGFVTYRSFVAWANVRLHVIGSTCNTSANIITFNAGGYAIDLSKVNVTQSETGEAIHVVNFSPDSNNLTLTSSVSNEANFEIHLEKFPSFGEQLDIQISYSLAIQEAQCQAERFFDYGLDGRTLRGIYIYNGLVFKNFAKRNEKFAPLHSADVIPIFGHHDPTQRATFKIAVAHPDDYTALSNMDIVETTRIEEKEGWVRDHFRKSPPLQLDQVSAMIILGFQKNTYYENQPNENCIGNCTTVNVWTLANLEKSPDQSIANRTAEKIRMLLQLFEVKFNGTEYPLNKLDYVIVPDGIDACSSLGLLTAPAGYSGINKLDMKSTLDAIISRQIATQWIGEMVTHGNEERKYSGPGKGIINLVTTWAPPNYEGSWSVFTKYEDCYEAHLLEMLQEVFSPQLVQHAIAQFYLPKMKWKSAFFSDFCDALHEAILFHNSTHLLPSSVNVTIKDIMAGWIKHNEDCYPRVLASHVENDTSSIYFSFKPPTDGNGCWGYCQKSNPLWVPVTISTESGEELRWFFYNCSSMDTFRSVVWASSLINTSKWILVNSQQSYEVIYSAPLLNNIITQLNINHTVIPVQAREKIVPAKIPRSYNWSGWKSALERTTYLANELNPRVWNDIFDEIASLHKLSSRNEEALNLTMEYFGGMMAEILNKIGVTRTIGEDESVTFHRRNLLRFCATYNQPVCVQYAQDLMAKWINNPEFDPFPWAKNSVGRDQLYCAAVAANQTPFHFMLDRLLNFNFTFRNYQEGMIMAKSLSCTRNNSLLLDLLNNTKLANGSFFLQLAQKTVLPSAILEQRPFTMTENMFNFLVRERTEGDMNPLTFLRFLKELIPNLYKRQALADKILQFLEEKQDLLFNDLTSLLGYNEIKKLLKEAMVHMEKFWNEFGYNLINWYREKNMERTLASIWSHWNLN